jgi:photosystem II stability/assembly factor-like uncharacterized protein
MRVKGEEETKVSSRGGAGTPSRAAAGGTPESPRARSFRAARARAAKVGGKAAARLQSFVQQRGLVETAGGGPQTRAPTARTARANAHAGATADSDYQRALAAPLPREVAGAAEGPVWRFLGPRWIPKGQTYGRGPGSTPSVAGRVTAIGVDPVDGRHLLLGSAGGGIWETRDRGRTWTPRTDDQPSLGIGALAFDPSDPMKAYAGTGEGNTREVPGQGLLMSADGGTTWSLTAADPFAGAFFFCLLVDPTDGDRLLAATRSGVFVTADAGGIWNRTRNPQAWDLSFGTAVGAPTEVLAACLDGLHRSGDGGSTWHEVPLPGGPASFTDSIGRMAVAHAPADAGVAYVFAAEDDSVWLWRRGEAGGPFAEVELPSLDPPGSGSAGYGISQSWYDWCLAVAPDDPDTVFLGAVDVFRGHRSSSGRWSWTDISTRFRGESIHPDQHCLVFDPSNPKILYAGNDGGIFRSPDRGDSWTSINKGLAIAEFEYLAQHPRHRTWMIGGTQDNGTLRHRRDGIWDQVALGDGGDCAVRASSPDTCYHSYYGMAMDRSHSSGDRWTDVTPPVPDDYDALFYPPLEANGSTVARAGESVLVSDDEGRTWIDVPLPAGGVATAMTFASDTRILVGRQDGSVVSIDRLDRAWDAPRALGRPRRAYLSDLLAQPGSTRLWATYSAIGGKHVFLSIDDGATWVDTTANLPDVPVNAIEADPQAPDRLWVATDIGVFESTDGGGTWSLFGRGLPRALAVDLIFHARLRLLRVGTRSRGVWEIEIT